MKKLILLMLLSYSAIASADFVNESTNEFGPIKYYVYDETISELWGGQRVTYIAGIHGKHHASHVNSTTKLETIVVFCNSNWSPDGKRFFAPGTSERAGVDYVCNKVGYRQVAQQLPIVEGSNISAAQPANVTNSTHVNKVTATSKPLPNIYLSLVLVLVGVLVGGALLLSICFRFAKKLLDIF